jgi:hypothetical protein
METSQINTTITDPMNPEYWVGRVVTLSSYNFQISRCDDPEDMGMEQEDFEKLLETLKKKSKATIVSLDTYGQFLTTEAYYTFKFENGVELESCNFYRFPQEFLDAGIPQDTDY